MIITGAWFLLIAGLGISSVISIIRSLILGHFATHLYFILGLFIACLGIELVLLLSLKSQVKTYATAWKSVGSSSQKDFIYVAMGDSAAQGIGASNINKGYVKIIADLISDKSGRRVTIINISKSGAKLNDMMKDQLPQLKNLKPNLITVDIGANDITGGTSDKQMEQELKLIIRSVNSYPTVFANLPDFMWGKEQRNTKSINKVIADSCAKNGVALADLHYETMKTMWRTNEFAADGFHPSNTGHKTWAKAFTRVLNGVTSVDTNRILPLAP